MSAVPEIVADTRCALGESPVWHAREGRLYWIDIPAGQLYVFDPDSGNVERLLRTGAIGAMTVQQSGGLLLLLDGGCVGEYHHGEFEMRRALRHIRRDYRFNDAIADPEGRVFSGTMHFERRPSTIPGRLMRKLRRLTGRRTRKPPGDLYRLDVDGSAATVVAGVGRPNGMGFSPDVATFYATDTLAGAIYAFDYCRSSGDIGNRRTLIRHPVDGGRPDGMTVDSEGSLWCAIIDRGCLARFDAAGHEIERFTLPVRRPTSIAFGGGDYRDLYVTSAGGHRRERDGEAAGALVRLRTTTPGLPEYASRFPV